MLKDIRFFTDVRLLFIIGVAACVVDTVGLFVWKQFPRSAAISQWYDKLGVFAYTMDVTSIVLGIFLAQVVTSYVGGPWNPAFFCGIAVLIQQVHDILFAKFVVPVVRNNDAIDIMKQYIGHKSSRWILFFDALYMVATSLLAMVLYEQKTWVSVILLCFALYVTGYAIFAHPSG